LLAGCSSNGNQSAGTNNTSQTNKGTESTASTNEPIEITFWNLFGGGEGDFVDQIVNGFNESQQEVIVKTLRLESNEYYAKFGTALAAGKGPTLPYHTLIA